MDRLTNGIEYCKLHCDFKKLNECFFSNKDKCYERNMYNKLKDYEDAEEQRLLLRLPCKIGDTIYVNGILEVGEAEEYKVIRVDYHSNLATKRSEFYIEALLVSDPENSIGFYNKEIGNTVFLTKVEAEQKLKEMKDK